MPILGKLTSALLCSTMLGGPTGGGSVGPASVTYITSRADTSNAATYTFTASNIGAEAADRIVVVTAGTETTGGATVISSITIGGNTATEAVQYGVLNRTVAGIFYLEVPTGTTADIVVNFSSASCQRCVIGIWNINGASSSTPYDTDTVANSTGASTTTTLSNLDFPDNSVGICVIVSGDSGAMSWANANERYETDTAEGLHHESGADLTQATATTTLDITVTHPGVAQGLHMVGASWA
jgi:hypothetical protein